MTPCKCTTPPGGGGRCGLNQIAICRAEAGECHITCIDLNDDLSEKLINNRLDTQEMIKLVSLLFGQEYTAVNGSTLISADGSSTIRYTLPKTRGRPFGAAGSA